MDIIKPGIFGKTFAADEKRLLFDFHNHQLMEQKTEIDYVFIGDSITEYWNINAYLNDLGFIVNRGVGGDISEIVLKRFDADVLQLKPRHVVCLIGCNDLLSTQYDFWWKKKGRDEEEVITELLKNIEGIINKCSDLPLFMASILPSKLCVPYDAEGFNNNIIRINQEIKLLCEKYGVQYLDYHSAMCAADGKTILEGITYDGIHPTPDGYQIMARVLKEKLQAVKNG